MTIKRIGIDIGMTGAEKVTALEASLRAAGVAANGVDLSFAKLSGRLQQLSAATSQWASLNNIAISGVHGVAGSLATEANMVQLTAAQIERLNADLAIMAGTSKAAAASTVDLAGAHGLSAAAAMRTAAQTRALGLAQLEAIKWNGQMASGLRLTSGELVNHAAQTSLAERMIMRMVLAYAAYKTISGVLGTAKDAADYEMLGVAMNVVGQNAGYSANQMAAFEKSMTGPMGIAPLGARKVLAEMAAAHLDLSKAAAMSTMAQNVGRVANINSTEAFERMVQSIVTAQPKMLHTLRVLVNFEEAYKNYKTQLNIVGGELTEGEKVQARFNESLKYGENYARTYAAAFGTAGSQILSNQRYAEKARISIGSIFSPEILAAVATFGWLLRAMADHASIAVGILGTLGFTLVTLGVKFGIAKVAAMEFAWAAIFNPVTAGIMAISAALAGVIILFDRAKRVKEDFAVGLGKLTDAELASQVAAQESYLKHLKAKPTTQSLAERFTSGVVEVTTGQSVMFKPDFSRQEDMLSAARREVGDRLAASIALKAIQDKAISDEDARQRADEAKRAAAQLKKDQAALDKKLQNVGPEATREIENLKSQAQAELALAAARDKGVEALDRVKVAQAGKLAYDKKMAEFTAEVERAKETHTRLETNDKGVPKDLAYYNEAKASYEAAAEGLRTYAMASKSASLTDEHATEAVKAHTKAVKDFDDAVGEPIAKLVAEGDALDRMTLARKQGKEATDAERIALAGEAAARDILNKAMEKGVSLKNAMLGAAVGGIQASENERKTIGIEKIKKAAQDAESTLSRLWRGVQDGLANAIEEGFKRGFRTGWDFINSMGALLADVLSKALAAGIAGKLRGASGSFGALAGLGAFSSPISAQTPNVANAAVSGVGGGSGILGAIGAHPMIAAGAAVIGVGVALFAMGEKAKRAAEAIKSMAVALDASITRYRAEAGLTTTKAADIADEKARAQALRQLAIDKANAERDRVNSNFFTTRWAKDHANAKIDADLAYQLGLINEAEKIHLTAIENGTDALNKFAGALNEVSGYKYQAAIFAGAHPHDNPFTPSGPVTAGGGGSSGGGGGDGTTFYATIVMPNGEVLTKVVLRGLRATAQRQFGDTSRWSEVQ